MSEKIFELRDVGFRASDKQILNQINYSIKEGQIITVSGPSGSGKSTLLKIMGLLLSPTSGEIRYKGKNIMDYEPTEYRKEVSYFFQNAVLFDETVRENLAFPSEIRDEEFDEERALKGLETVQLPRTYIDKPIKELSGGEKQRVALIRNLMYPPKVLLMDEVTSSLDSVNREIIVDFVHRLNKEENVTILWITHNQDEIDASNDLITIVDGELEDVENGK